MSTVRATAQRRLFATATGTSRFLSFDEARSYMHTCGLKSWREWVHWNADGRRPYDIPGAPHTYYTLDGWKGYSDWLGNVPATPSEKEKKKVRSSTMAVQSGSSPETARQGAWNELKQYISASVEAHLLPVRSSATLVFRPAGEELWSPLVMRSAAGIGKGKNKTACFFENIKWTGGAGFFLVVRESRRKFFIPHEYLDNRYGMLRGTKKAKKTISVPLVDLSRYEVDGMDEIARRLAQHRDACTLLREEEFCTELFSGPFDAAAQHLGQRALNFFRDKCELDMCRPVANPCDASFVLGGKVRIVARLCLSRFDRDHLQSRRVDVRKFCNPFLVGDDTKATAFERCAHFLMALHADNGDAELRAASKGRMPRLRGIFLFPRAYLRRQGLFDGARQTMNCAIYVHPPEAPVRRVNVRRKQIEQSQFYIDLSPDADESLAVAKARELFAAHGTTELEETKLEAAECIE